jgi:nucleotide-binding universal stress UspA family protein
MIKDILVNLGIGKSRDVAGNFALSLAEAFDARVTGTAFIYDTTIPMMAMDGGMLASYVDELRQRAIEEASQSADRFEKTARKAGISAEVRTPDTTLPGAGDLFGKLARTCDVSVVAQPEPNKAAPEELIIEGALFGSGRPVIVVPYIQKMPLKLNRVTVCWDGSVSAARAVNDALPLLKKSNMIDLLTVDNDDNRSGEIPGLDMAQHLAHKGFKVDLKRITSIDDDVASTILSFAADTSSDFLVMGGYGHSRLREFVLGGATRGMLESMTLPTLMSH